MKKKMEYDPTSGKPFLHPGRQADMIYEGKVVGYLGEVHPLLQIIMESESAHISQ